MRLKRRRVFILVMPEIQANKHNKKFLRRQEEVEETFSAMLMMLLQVKLTS